MKGKMIVVNGVFNPAELPDLDALQRGFFYGDSLFETIRISQGKILWFDKHWKRLLFGMELCEYVIPESWNPDYFINQINQFGFENARVRLTVWRSSGGFYTPSDNFPQYLIMGEPLADPAWPSFSLTLSAGVVEDIRLPIDRYSSVKTLNAPRYVMAASISRRNGWDEGLIRNSEGRLCEGTTSNFFWAKGDFLFTPPLSEGCIDGIMRHSVIEIIPALGLVIREKSATLAALEEADEVFFTNVIRGIRPVSTIGTVKYRTSLAEIIHSALIREITGN